MKFFFLAILLTKLLFVKGADDDVPPCDQKSLDEAED
jgi:hypothetical protein